MAMDIYYNPRHLEICDKIPLSLVKVSDEWALLSVSDIKHLAGRSFVFLYPHGME